MLEIEVIGGLEPELAAVRRLHPNQILHQPERPYMKMIQAVLQQLTSAGVLGLNFWAFGFTGP
jgi:hypothetical protein